VVQKAAAISTYLFLGMCRDLGRSTRLPHSHITGTGSRHLG
jgi:hypothetical protein